MLKTVTGLFVMLFISTTCLAVPAQINFQGMLEDVSGPVDYTVTMTFRLYDMETNGSPLWEEEQIVDVDQGVYNVILGTGTINPSYGDLADALFSSDDLWLEVQVAGESPAMSPRQKVVSVGFAIRAGEADTVPNASITEAKLAPDAVTTDKLADGAITAAKVSGGIGSELDADLLDGQQASAFGAASTVSQNQTDIAALQAEIQALKNLLSFITKNGNDVTFSGVNVHIVNGTGTTDGTVNGQGNLVVGYNETRGSGDDRNGSHNIVVGTRQNYSSYGGLETGYHNTISAAYASISCGAYNTASGSSSSVSGGHNNTASGQESSITGGESSEASEFRASVTGGYDNTAGGEHSSVTGGRENNADPSYASISGGLQGNVYGVYDWRDGDLFSDH